MSFDDSLFQDTFQLALAEGSFTRIIPLTGRMHQGQEVTSGNGQHVVTRLYRLPSEEWLLLRRNSAPQDCVFDRAWFLTPAEAQLWRSDPAQLELSQLRGWLVTRVAPAQSDNSHWQRPYRTLREQFLQASNEDLRIQLHLTCFPKYHAYEQWYHSRIDWDMKRTVSQRGNQTSQNLVWGDSLAVVRFEALATAAGNALPVAFRMRVRIFPGWNEIANRYPTPCTLWGEYLYLARFMDFEITEDSPEPGCRIAKLRGNPFLASALAIDRYLLAPPDQSLAIIKRELPHICSWLFVGSAAPAAAMDTADAPDATSLLSDATEKDTPLDPDAEVTPTLRATGAGDSNNPGEVLPSRRGNRRQTEVDKGESRTQPEVEHSSISPTPSGTRRNLKQPTADAIKAFRLHVATGKKQLELAALLTRELKRPINQGTVSRWLKEVKKWLAAGNILPDLSVAPITKMLSVDPERLELGRRLDHRPQHLRGRRNSEDDS